MKYFIQDHWLTDLQCEIKLNDLRQDMKACCAELNKLSGDSTMEDMVKIAHKHGMKLNLKLVPNEKK